MIGLAKDYQRATELIAYLAKDADLEPLVFPEVFCRVDQASSLGARALSYGGAVAVGLGLPANIWSGDRGMQVPRLYATFFVHVFVSALARPPEPHGDFFSFAAGLTGRCLALLTRWEPYGADSVHLPVISGVTDLDLGSLPDMDDVVGRSIALALPVNF